MSIWKAPEPWPQPIGKSVFLAGSIEMGKAEDWQTHAERVFDEHGFVVLNPRRDDWDSSWVQSIDNPQFRQQVEWELDGLDDVRHVLLHLCPETQSPISLLELGLYAPTGKLVVSCAGGFWRKGNVDIVCARHNVPVFEKLDGAILAILKRSGS